MPMIERVEVFMVDLVPKVKRTDAIQAFVDRWGWGATFGMVLLLGAGLNLTPCVYPLVSVTLAYFGGRTGGNTVSNGFAHVQIYDPEADTWQSSSQPGSPLAPLPQARFANVDILVDPHGTSLAAYQLEFVADPKRVTLVGIEGGEHAAFVQPPYYDPKALAGNRVILAALNTGKDLPSGKTRVARLHLRIIGNDAPALSAKLVVAASSNDKTIPADVSVSSQGVNQ